MNRLMMTASLSAFLMMTILVNAIAGSLDSPGAPAAGSGMPTTSGIYNQLDTGVTTSSTASFQEPTSGPGSGGRSLSEVQDKLPLADNVNGAAASEVRSGKTFWGLNSGEWGAQTGSLPTQTLSDTDTTVSAGYYDATTLGDVDTDLFSGNIKSGVSIFGVSGNSNVVDTSSGDAINTGLAVGKKAWVDGVEVTGTLYGGYTCNGTMNGTRWCDNGDGTVRDLTTGLVWLQSTNCTETLAGIDKSTGSLSWDNAGVWSGVLTSGRCGLTDGSVEGDWRLPTKNELYAVANGLEPVESSIPRSFSGVQENFYWSSSTFSGSTISAWLVNMNYGYIGNYMKTNTYYAWPVRGGQ